MIEREDAPRFEICVLQGDNVLRQDRLYARASAQVLAETWRAALAGVGRRGRRLTKIRRPA